MTEFTLTEDVVALPTGAWAAVHRRTLRRDGKGVLALTQGKHRAYVYPLFTPAGYAVTSEHPADHPHHNSFWIAADHVYCRMPVTHGHGFEEYTYNLYLNETFQGRAAGSIFETAHKGAARGDGYEITQTLDWRGPVEWAAPQGRLAARETRIMRIATEAKMHIIDVESRLEAVNWDFTLGPTRHAYFNMRIADSMIVALGGRVQDDRGRTGGDAVSGSETKWIDYSGPVGGGHVAGVSVFPDPRDHEDIWWFVADWGVITVGPFRGKQWLVRKGEHLKARYRILVHDGDAQANDIAGRYRQYVDGLS